MKTLTPQLFLSMKQYTKEQFTKDVVSGIIVAIIALPLSIALALASGVTPEQGLYTAIIAGFVISFLGGSKVQIAGPTAAFATIVAGIVMKNGMEGLATATILAGLILVIMGFLRLGGLIRFIPYTITTGFTTGIAVTIFIGQIKDFLGLTFRESPVETMEKLGQVITCIDTLNLQALAVGAVSLAILILWPRFFKKVPPSLIAVAGAAGGTGSGQRGLSAFRRHSGHRRHRKDGCQHKERRAQPGGRYGPCGGASADSGISHALCRPDSHARHSGHPVHGGL